MSIHPTMPSGGAGGVGREPCDVEQANLYHPESWMGQEAGRQRSSCQDQQPGGIEKIVCLGEKCTGSECPCQVDPGHEHCSGEEGDAYAALNLTLIGWLL